MELHAVQRCMRHAQMHCNVDATCKQACGFASLHSDQYTMRACRNKSLLVCWLPAEAAALFDLPTVLFKRWWNSLGNNDTPLDCNAVTR